MKIKTETQTGSIVSFKYDDEIAEITGLTTSFEPSQEGTPSMNIETGNMVSFDGIEETNIYDVKADINPVQDLHGYDKPWAGGNGKNILPPTTTQTISGTTFTVSSDGVVTISGTSTADKNLEMPFTVSESGNYYFNGCADGGGYNTNFDCFMWDSTNNRRAYKWDGSTSCESAVDSSQSREIKLISGIQYKYIIRVRNGFVASNQKFYPMVRKSTESATYEPYSNICPISGWTECNVCRTGKNWFKTNASTETIQGVTFTINADGTVSVSGTPTGYAHKTIGFAKVKSSMGTVILSGLADSTNIKWDAIRFYDSNNVLLGDIQDRADDIVIDLTQYPTIDYITAEIKRASNGTAVGGTLKPQIELGTTASAWEPYKGDTFIIDLDGTRYGGTLDVTSGVLTVTHEMLVFNGGSNESWHINNPGTANWYYEIDRPNAIVDSPPIVAARSNRFESNEIYNGNITKGIWRTSVGLVRIRTNAQDTVENWKTWLSNNNVQVLSELVTPLTVQLTPTQIEALIGENNIWADTGDVTVTYGDAYPISGWDEVKAYVSPTEEEEDATIYTINLNGTRYGGDIDFFSGKMLVTHGFYTVTGNESVTWAFSNRSGVQIAYANLSSIMTGVKTTGGVQQTALFDKFKTSRTAGGAGIGDAYVDNGYVNLGFSPNMFATSNDVKAWLRSVNIEVVYELATPLEVQLTAEQIEALQGQNYVWCDSGDTTLTWRHIPVLDEAVMLNGKYLELTIDGYSTLGTSGRRSLGRQLDTYSVGTTDGETVKNSVFPSRKITVNYVIQTDTEEELTDAINQLANILNQDECDFVFRDESDKFFSGYGLLDSEPKKYRHAVKGTWSLYCAYPFKRSNKLVELSSKDPTVASVDAHSATFVFDYNGTLPAHPILRAEFASAKSGGEYTEDGDCGYVAFLDAEENIIQLGNPEVLDVDQYANATLINREFTSLSGWTASGVTVGDLTDQFWQNGKGQTQSYAKGTGSFTKSVGNGAINMEFDIVHRLCVSAANQTGAFECYAKNGNTIVVGFKIEKTGSGTTGVVSYILNNKVVGTDSIDLSYYNTHFGYCNRTAVYGTVYESVYESYYVKKKKKKKKKWHWVTYPRTVQTGWSYTQSNLNSGWSKDGSVIVFSIGNLADRTFKNSDVELTPSTSIVFNISGSFHTNAVHSCAMLSKAGVPFAEIPNVFTAGDVVEGDCNSADVMLYRAGSLEGHLEPQYGALGNDWEDFEIKPGKNIIRAVWSDWVNTSYKPEIKIIFNEVYV